jgi:hypothetical protein
MCIPPVNMCAAPESVAMQAAHGRAVQACSASRSALGVGAASVKRTDMKKNLTTVHLPPALMRDAFSTPCTFNTSANQYGSSCPEKRAVLLLLPLILVVGSGKPAPPIWPQQSLGGACSPVPYSRERRAEATPCVIIPTASVYESCACTVRLITARICGISCFD